MLMSVAYTLYTFNSPLGTTCLLRALNDHTSPSTATPKHNTLLPFRKQNHEYRLKEKLSAACEQLPLRQ